MSLRFGLYAEMQTPPASPTRNCTSELLAPDGARRPGRLRRLLRHRAPLFPGVLDLAPTRWPCSAPPPSGRAASASASRCTRCRCATRCGWPARSPRRTSSPAAGSKRASAAATPGCSSAAASISPRAAAASRRPSRSSSGPGPRTTFSIKGTILPLQGPDRRPEAAAEAAPAAVHRRHQPDDLRDGRPAGLGHVPAAAVAVQGDGAEHQRLPRPRRRRRATSRTSSTSARSTSATTPRQIEHEVKPPCSTSWPSTPARSRACRRRRS